MCIFRDYAIFTMRAVSSLPTLKLEDHPLSAVRVCYSIYSQINSILEAVPPFATRRSAMLWGQVPTYHGFFYFFFFFHWHYSPLWAWPVEKCPFIFSYLPPTLSIFSLSVLEHLFLLPLSIFSWVFPFFSSLPVLE